MNEPMNQVLGPPRDDVSQRHLAGQNTIDCLYARMGKGVAVEVDVQLAKTSSRGARRCLLMS